MSHTAEERLNRYLTGLLKNILTTYLIRELHLTRRATPFSTPDSFLAEMLKREGAEREVYANFMNAATTLASKVLDAIARVSLGVENLPQKAFLDKDMEWFNDWFKSNLPVIVQEHFNYPGISVTEAIRLHPATFYEDLVPLFKATLPGVSPNGTEFEIIHDPFIQNESLDSTAPKWVDNIDQILGFRYYEALMYRMDKNYKDSYYAQAPYLPMVERLYNRFLPQELKLVPNHPGMNNTIYFHTAEVDGRSFAVPVVPSDFESAQYRDTLTILNQTHVPGFEFKVLHMGIFACVLYDKEREHELLFNFCQGSGD